MYLMIGNILKDIRRQASSHAIEKFDYFTEKVCQAMRYCTFHHCMSILTESLINAGTDRVDMTCPNGFGQFLLLMWLIVT